MLDIQRQTRNLPAQRPIGIEIRPAIGTVCQMRLHQSGLGGIERAVDVPGQQALRRAMGIVMQLNDIAHDLSYTQSASSPANRRCKWRLAWNMRVFTVSTGQLMIWAISRYPISS